MESIKADENKLNELYNSSFIAFLQFYFMPVNFLWANYISRDLDFYKNSIDSGWSVERTIRLRKNLIGQAVSPSNYVTKTLCATLETHNTADQSLLNSLCFKSILTKNRPSKKTSQKTCLSSG